MAKVITQPEVNNQDLEGVNLEFFHAATYGRVEVLERLSKEHTIPKFVISKSLAYAYAFSRVDVTAFLKETYPEVSIFKKKENSLQS